jgi:uncharacterized protein (DUF1697 family)
MRTFVFLRAVNTTGRRVKMDELRRAVASAELLQVQSFLASGNLIIDSETPIEASTIEAAIESRLGLSSMALLRTAGQVEEVLASVPLIHDPGLMEIAFLDTLPSASAVSALLAAARGPDRLSIIGRELYWWRPLPLVPPFPKETAVRRLLGMKSTRRTLRTVQRIASTYIEHG